MSEYSAATVLKELGATYSHAKTYQDFGYVETASTSQLENSVTKKSPKHFFSTRFKRPNLFRFEYRDRIMENSEEYVSVTWSNGQNIYQRIGHEQVQVLREFTHSKNGSLTIRRDTAPPILAILMPSFHGPKLTDFDNVRYAGEEMIADEACHHLCEVFLGPAAPREMSCWISKARMLLVTTRESLIIDPARIDALYSALFDDSTSHLENELKAQALKSAMRKIVAQKCMQPMEEWKRKALLASVESRVDIQDTYYTNVTMDADISDSAFTL